MPLRSIPPANGSHVRGRGALQSAATVRATPDLLAISGLKTPGASTLSSSPRARSTRHQHRMPSPPVVVSPSVYDVRVIRTSEAVIWQFPYGEFEVVRGGDEVHIEVRIGRFSDALILKTGKGKAEP